MTEVRTVGTALLEGTHRLRAAGSPTPRLDAELLVGHVTGRDRGWLLAHPEAELDNAAVASLDAFLERRADGEPVAYIRGFKEWHSLRIWTDHRGLIPRPETELLVDAAVAEISARLARAGVPVVAWEIGTGSGAVAVVLALRFRAELELERATLIASDASPSALELASQNLVAHGVDGLVTTWLADLLAPAGGPLPRPDVVVANLPYVSSAEVDERHGSLGYEPRIAVDGGPDGLGLLRRLFVDLPTRAAPGATVLLETGVGQAGAISALVPHGSSVTVVPDLAGLDRVLRVDLPRRST
jgi:release factor glutamine methyltransferase